jgi:DNA polymerase elongation subunit (family B)
MDSLPTLLDIIGEKNYTPVIKTISRNKPIDFFPIRFMDKNVYAQGSRRYVIVCYGNLLSGIPCCLILEDIYLPIYVLQTFAKKVVDLLDNQTSYYKYSTKLEKLKSLYEYGEAKYYIAINFLSSIQRTMAINLLTTNGITVYDNNKSQLHRNVLARYGIAPSQWIKITDYRSDVASYTQFHNGITLTCKMDNIKNIQSDDKLHVSFKQRKMAWDIETRTFNPNGRIEFDRIECEGTHDIIFMISVSIKWCDGDDIIDVILTTINVDEPTVDPSTVDISITDKSVGYKVILCENQFDLIDKFFDIIERYRPNIILDFNGYGFDWPMVNRRLEFSKTLYHKVGRQMMLCSREKEAYDLVPKPRDVRIKIKGDQTHEGECFEFIDCMCLDLLPALLKEFDYSSGKKANFQSLNKFLEDNKLPLKRDLPYEIMNRYFDNGTQEQRNLIAEYCMYDSKCLHDLEEKRNMINGIDAISNMTFTTKDMGVYMANGAKIINAVKADCYRRGYVFRQRVWTRGFLVPFGGLVLEPNKGLHVYNSFDEKYSDDLKKELSMRDLKFKSDSIKATKIHSAELHSPRLKRNLKTFTRTYPPKILDIRWVSDRPEFAIDYVSLYPSVILGENLCPSTKIPVTDRHLYPDIKVRKHTFANETFLIAQHDNDPEKMGILPGLLFRMLKVKAEMKKLKNGATLEAKRREYENYEKATKLILNSTYGILGDPNNRYFCDNFLFQGTTNLGRFFLLIAKIYCEHGGITVNYGDTDSLYVYFPNSYFVEVDRLFQSGSLTDLEYKERMVDITVQEGKKFNNKLNSVLQDIGAPFMSLAFEECILGFHIKKKFYCGLNDDNGKFNHAFFKTDDPEEMDKMILQRGIVTRKRDKSEFVKVCFYKLMKRCFDPNLKISLKELLLEQVEEIKSGSFDIKLLKQHAMYKQGKLNTRINTFVERMAKFGHVIEDLQKFKYLVVKMDYTLEGKRITRIGERMFLSKIVKERGLEIDKAYYIESYIKAVVSLLGYRYTPLKAKKKLMEPLKYDKRSTTQFNKTIYKACKNEDFNIGSLELSLKLSDGDILQLLINDVITAVETMLFMDRGIYLANGKFIIKLKPMSIRGEELSSAVRKLVAIMDESWYKTTIYCKSIVDKCDNRFKSICSEINLLKKSCSEELKKYEKYLITNIESMRETKNIAYSNFEGDNNSVHQINELRTEMIEVLKKMVLYNKVFKYYESKN